MNNTIDANNIFINPCYKEVSSKKNNILKCCYKSLEILDNMKGELGTDQINYIDEYLHRIIMILSNNNNENKVNIFKNNFSKKRNLKLFINLRFLLYL